MTAMPSSDLPVRDVLPRLRTALAAGGAAVLVAPPGAGKTTAVAPALLDEPWMRGPDGTGMRLLLLAPRRLAARAAAARMATGLASPVGETVGYTVRLDSRTSAATRIEVMTEGVFIRRLIADPELGGVAGVLFDEVHERSLDGDTALALALDVRGALRPDLRLLAMSATVDGARFARLLGGAPVIESAGRIHPVTTHHIPRDPQLPLEARVAAATERALAETGGDVLVFLPGTAEIARARRALEARGLPDRTTAVVELHGSLDPRAQDGAIAPAPAGQRKVVLSTAIAETSLTIAGVQAVVDTGLARRPAYEPDTGFTRLVTVRASRASADQRRGRAGRTGPGRCYRLWSEAETGALPAFDSPQILSADLAGLALTLAAWGVGDPAQLAWLDPPPAPAWREAVALLQDLGALDPAGRLTEAGAALSVLPLPPRLAHMIVEAGRRFGLGRTAARVAAVLSERGLGGPGVDVAGRVERLERDSAPLARRAVAQADGWWRSACAGRTGPGGPAEGVEPDRAGLCLALAWPGRIARARDRSGSYLMAGGRAGALDPADPLAAHPFLAVAELQGSAAGARILAAAILDEADLETVARDTISVRTELVFEPQTGLRARQQRRLGAITLASTPVPVTTGPQTVAALLDGIRRHGLEVLPWTGRTRQLRDRLAFLHGRDPQGWPATSDAALLETAGDWLAAHLEGLTALDRLDLERALTDLAPGGGRQLDRLAPPAVTTPLGHQRPVRYDADAGPVLEVRVQELFGLDRHPVIAESRPGAGDGVPLTLELTSPAHRPVARTRDLPAFWRAGWRDVRKDMKADYPRHPWPERPWEAQATLRAKPRGS